MSDNTTPYERMKWKDKAIRMMNAYPDNAELQGLCREKIRLCDEVSILARKNAEYLEVLKSIRTVGIDSFKSIGGSTAMRQIRNLCYRVLGEA